MMYFIVVISLIIVGIIGIIAVKFHSFDQHNKANSSVDNDCCTHHDFEYIKEDDTSFHVPYGCEYGVLVCKKCGHRK